MTLVPSALMAANYQPVGNVAMHLGVRAAELLRLVDAGALAARRIGGRVCVEPDAARAALNR